MGKGKGVGESVYKWTAKSLISRQRSFVQQVAEPESAACLLGHHLMLDPEQVQPRSASAAAEAEAHEGSWNSPAN